MTERSEDRDERIEMEIIIDAYTADEQAMGWHIYLEETMEFPFDARCIEEQEVSPLEEGETVRVVGKPVIGAVAPPAVRDYPVDGPGVRCPTESTGTG